MHEPLPVSEKTLLLAYLVSRYSAIRDAHQRLADIGEGSRAGAINAQESCDQLSWRWAQEIGLEILDPHERLLAVLRYCVENAFGMAKLTFDLAPEGLSL